MLLTSHRVPVPMLVQPKTQLKQLVPQMAQREGKTIKTVRPS